jgi:hypothetical protein
MAAIRGVDITDPTTTVSVQEVQLYTVGANGIETNVNDLRIIVGNSRADLRYGIDADGEIYVMTKTDGFIRKLVGIESQNELILQVDPVTGEARVRNATAFSATIEGYSILSSSGSLRPTDAFWHSLADQGASGWLEASPTANALSELNPLSQMQLASGAGLNLGALFNPAGSEDLAFEFQIVGNAGTTTGIVMYCPLLAGDFNRNGVVDGADYVVWRKTSGQQVPLGTGADGNGDGSVDITDYQLWRTHFGSTATASGAGASDGAAVPEPSTLQLFVVAGLAFFKIQLLSRRIRCRAESHQDLIRHLRAAQRAA